MKIGIFAYNFEHQKTQSGILNLLSNGFKPDVVFAADYVNLSVHRSSLRMQPKDIYLIHPKKLCYNFNIDYFICEHNSDFVCEKIKEYNLDIGIILGSRILKQNIIKCFNIGVLNMHPGILPENRGLDTIKWAIIRKERQGVTTHFIDENIDRGILIDTKNINIYEDDTILDLFLRVASLEQQMMISSLERIINNETFEKRLECGNYNSPLYFDIESNLMKEFDEYKKIMAVNKI